MASRVSEVIYRLKDLFTGPAKKVNAAYARIREASGRTSKKVASDSAKMGKSLGALSSKAKGLVGIFAGGLLARGAEGTFSDLANELDRLGKTADRLAIDPNTLSAFEFAAERSGVSVERVTASIATLQKRTGEAAQGIGRAKIAFDTLGIAVDDFIKLDAEEQLYLLADGISTLANEEDRAAVAAQLFSKANTEMLNVIGNGSAAVRELVEQGKAYRNITKEQTDAAAAYNDALSNLGRQVDAIKFDKLTPALAQFSEFLDNIGAGDKLKGLTTELILLEKEVAKSKLSRLFSIDRRSTGELLSRIYQVRNEIDDYRGAQEQATAAQDARAASLVDAQAENQKHQQQIESLTETYKAQLDTLKETLAAETAERQAARAEQAQIEREFAALVKDVTTPEKTDVSLADVFYADTQARAALAQGDIEASIAFARQGADLLGRLKQEGTETEGTLGFLAKKLQDVAREASQQKVALEVVDVDQAEAGVEGIKNKLAALESDAVTIGSQIGKAFVAALNTELGAATITAPALTEAAPPTPAATGARRIVRDDNNSFRFETELERRGAK